jgi:CSLREA domain-containing protein
MNTQRWNRIIASAIMGLCLCSTAEAVITVTTTDDEDNGIAPCSLREAITAVNSGMAYGGCALPVPPETINFMLPDLSIITLESELPPLATSVTITGQGVTSLAVSGKDMFRVFDITAGTVTISDLTIRNGKDIAGAGLRFAAGSIGIITDSTISKNTGDGILSNATSLTVRRSTVSGNGIGGAGAGIHALGASTQIFNSTISSNKGTGILLDGPLLTMSSSTVTGNVDEGLFINGMVTAKVNNTIISGNGNELTTFNCMGTVDVLSNYNLEGTDFCGFTAANNIVNTDPQLEGLKDNGGPTLTHALKGGIGASRAINNGDPANCGKTLVVDQRGAARPSGSACDIGAYERQPGDTGGGSGSGCSSRAGKNAVLDPTLWLLVLISCIYLGYRRSYAT